MLCKQCGAELNEGTKFCGICGCENKIQNAEQIVVDIAPRQENEVKVATILQQPKKEKKVLRGILSVFCCIFIFVCSLASLALFTVRDSIKPEKIENLLENVDVQTLVESSSMNNLFADMSASDMEKIYRKTTIKDYVEDIANEYADYILGGKKPNGVEADDIISLMSENQYEIESILDLELSEADYRRTYEFFEDEGAENIGVLSADVRTNDILDAVRMILSLLVIIALLVLTAVFVLFLFKARRWSVGSFAWIGTTLIIVSVVFGVFAAVRPIILGFLSDFDPLVTECVGLFMSNALSVVLLNSGIVALTGVLMITISIIVKKIIKARN